MVRVLRRPITVHIVGLGAGVITASAPQGSYLHGCRRSSRGISLEEDIHAPTSTSLVLLLPPCCRWSARCCRHLHGDGADVAYPCCPLRVRTPYILHKQAVVVHLPAVGERSCGTESPIVIMIPPEDTGLSAAAVVTCHRYEAEIANAALAEEDGMVDRHHAHPVTLIALPLTTHFEVAFGDRLSGSHRARSVRAVHDCVGRPPTQELPGSLRHLAHSGGLPRPVRDTFGRLSPVAQYAAHV
jgi:hypothetical protein